jgi:hypothetical protein
MPQALPVSRVVNVGVILTPAGAQSQSLSDLLVLGTSTVLDSIEEYRLYLTTTDVLNDFGNTSEEYLAAQAWFSQAPQPTQLYVGRWNNAPSSGGLRGGGLLAVNKDIATWNAILNGGFKYQKDGGALTNVTGLNFAGAANLNGVAAIIQAALTGVAVKYNAAYGRFEFASSTAGPTSAFAFLQAPTAGTDISSLLSAQNATQGSYQFVGGIAETAAAAAARFDDRLGQGWYALNIPSASVADHIEVGGFLESTNNKHIYAITTQDPNTLLATSTTDLASQLKALAYRRTMIQYSSANKYAVISALSRILTTDFNGNNTVITLKFKQEPGVIAESLAASLVTNLEAKNCNVFVNYNNNTAIFEQGVMCSGPTDFIDIITSADWLAVTIQKSIYNVLYTSPTKIPQTDQGQQLLNTAAEAVCVQGVVNGMLAPGVWNSSGFGQLKQGDYVQKGYYLYSASFNTQNPADRTARRSMSIQIAAKLAGAIHDVRVTITVNQ